MSGLKYGRVLKICKFSWIWQGSEYALGCNYGRVLDIPGSEYAKFLRMQALLSMVLIMPQYGWIMPHDKVLNKFAQRFTMF